MGILKYVLPAMFKALPSPSIARVGLNESQHVLTTQAISSKSALTVWEDRVL
jgi:hypothetical protein